jgi:hypothetical protein
LLALRDGRFLGVLAHVPDTGSTVGTEGSLPPVDRSELFPPRAMISEPGLEEQVHPEVPVSQWLQAYRAYQRRLYALREALFALEAPVGAFRDGGRLSLQRFAALTQVSLLQWEQIQCCVSPSVKRLRGYVLTQQAIDSLRAITHAWRERQAHSAPGEEVLGSDMLMVPTVFRGLEQWEEAMAGLHVLEQTAQDLRDIPSI